MKQTSLWIGEGDRARAARWNRLPEKVRTEIVAQLVRLVVVSVTGKSKNTQKFHEEKR